MNDKFSELIRAGAPELPIPEVLSTIERRVMIEVARRALARSRARARRGVVASLAGLAMLLAGCLTALVVWFPTGTAVTSGMAAATGAVEAAAVGSVGGFLPTGAAGELMQRFGSWLEKVLAALPGATPASTTTPDASVATTGEIAAGAPLVEQWAGPILLMLLVAAVGGGIWYLNSLFSAADERR